MSSKTSPTTEVERQLFAAGARFVLGIDEVGRGAIAGPVAVGVAILDSKTNNIDAVPAGLRDSKLLSEKQREALIEPVREWVRASAVGYSSAEEIDNNGIVAALAMAASRALSELLNDAQLRVEIATDGAIILLDGSHNWLQQHSGGLQVVVRTKADRDCVSVAAASVISKVERDNLMIELATGFSGYGFEGHKGYASEAHILAIKTIGPSSEHRHTWLTKILGDGQLSFEE